MEFGFMPGHFCQTQKTIPVGVKHSVEKVHLLFADIPLSDSLPNQVHEIFLAY